MSVVVVVPGIAGSELTTQSAQFFGRVLTWMSPVNLLGGWWRLLGLAPDGISPAVSWAVGMDPGLPLRDYYSPLCLYLESQGWEVQCARLDWRQTIAQDASRLYDHVISLEDRQPIHIVAHSRGGLVLREVLNRLRIAGRLGIVDKVVGLGVPHRGSLAIIGTIGGWSPLVKLLAHVLGVSGGVIPIVLQFPSLMQLIWTWPAVYELLPSSAPFTLPPGDITALYSAANWAVSGCQVSAPWLQAAFDRWLNASDVPAGVSWLNVIGSGIFTPARLLQPDRLTSPYCVGVEPVGDDTVPEAWGVWPGRPTVRTPTHHQAYCYDGRVLAVVNEHLTNGITHDVTILGSFVG